jgi:hypothetical protein
MPKIEEIEAFNGKTLSELLSEKMLLVPDMDQACSLRDRFLLSFLMQGKGRLMFSGISEYEKQISPYCNERILFSNDKDIYETEYLVFDLADSVRNLPPYRTFGEASGARQQLLDVIEGKGEFLCEESSCANRSVSLEEIIEGLIGKANTEAFSGEEIRSRILLVVEEYLSEKKMQKPDTPDEALLWKFREERQRGVRRFFLDDRYHRTDDSSDEISLLRGVNRLGVVRRSISLEDTAISRLHEEISAHAGTIDRYTRRWLYLCDMQAAEKIEVKGRECLDAVYACAHCARSFAFNRNSFSDSGNVLEAVSDCSNTQIPETSLPEKRYGKLTVRDLSGKISDIKKVLPEKIPRDLKLFLDKLTKLHLDHIPLEQKLAEMDEGDSFRFLMYVLSEKRLDTHLYFIPVHWVEETREKAFWILAEALHRASGSVVLYGGTEEFFKRARKKKKTLEITSAPDSDLPKPAGSARKGYLEDSQISCRIRGSSIIFESDKRGSFSVFSCPGKVFEVSNQTISQLFSIHSAIARLFVSSMQARVAGLTEEEFLCNEKFRCSSCKGEGYYQRYLASGYSFAGSCDFCGGTGYSEKTETYKYFDVTFTQLLKMECSQVLGMCETISEIASPLKLLCRNGLGDLLLTSRVFELPYSRKVQLSKAVQEFINL